jgi:hypothetical protein
MAIGLFSSENFAGQNWLVTPAALAANETQPSSRAARHHARNSPGAVREHTPDPASR